MYKSGDKIMKIVNFNRRNKKNQSTLLDTFIDWNKQYCYDLNKKITSLYDYMIWNYPEYLIFNAPVSLSGNEDFKPYKSLVDRTVEPRLTQPYEKHIQIRSHVTNASENRSLFFPSLLNFHQGFYNQSEYGDAYIVELTSWIRNNKQCYRAFDDYYLMPWNVDEYQWIKYEIVNISDIIYVSESFDILHGQKIDDQKWVELSKNSDYTLGFDFEKHRQTINIEKPEKYRAIEIGRYKDAPINFPAGYICILNKQPIGENNETNTIKNTLSSYMIAPIGNGGYYNIWWNNNVLQADYTANELNNFSNTLTINLAQHCRYLNPSYKVFSFKNNNLNITIPNWIIDNTKVEPQLVDKYQNIWTGQEDIVARTYFNNEQVFADVQYDSFLSVVQQHNVHNFNAHVDQPFSLTQVDLLIY